MLFTSSIAFFLLLINCQASLAQKINWSESYEMSSIFNTNEIIQASAQDLYIAQKYKDEKYFFHRNIALYNKNFEKKDSKEDLSFHYKGLRSTYLFGISVKKQPFLCFLANDPNNQKANFIIDPLDTKTLKGKQQPISLFEVDYKNKQYDTQAIKYCHSQDQSKYLFYGKMPYAKKENAQIGMLVSNADFEELAAAAATLTQIAPLVDIKDVVDAVIDNEGNAYLLCKLYKKIDKKEEKKIGTRFVYTLIKMDKSAQVKVIDTLRALQPKDSTIVLSAKLSVNNDQQTVSCIGTYKTFKRIGRYRTIENKVALFKYRLEADNWHNEVAIQYPENFATAAYASQKQKKKKKKLGLDNYKIKQIIEQPKGSQIILAEQHYIKVFVDKSEGRQELHTLNNIYIAKISKQDSIHWIKTICKRQTGGAGGYTYVPQKLYSFFAFQLDSKLHILYNDLEANLAIKDELLLSAVDYNSPKDCGLLHCAIDAKKGTILQKKSLFQLKEKGVVIFPKATVLLEDNSLLLLGIKPAEGAKVKARYRFGRLVLE